ncbi:thiol:disulfide interchange protein DsbA/DsbL [Acinetobacter stercoris]|uniref:Thiol:disulfide interchange protein n=1 Tax=Acinetobacter stercoris TaxID=2126983 RepID=A0A2U3N2Z2_9GAMM|nr:MULTISPECIES: thiol:disulfide interchange protein DsbA/DsbL [Acinetobacter]SPL72003.1 Thiol:disulfide interchange protein DsbA precursor [Acinetobacter stercoris]
MKKFILGGMTAMVMAFSANTMAANFVAGKDYTVIKNPGKVDVPGKIEVREFFWYGCPHCFKLEPYMQTWLRSIPKDVHFVRTPAALNKIWEANARAYYVSEALGIRKNTHLPLFHAVQVENQQLFDQASQAKFFTKYGVPEAKFNSLYNSFAVSGKIAQSNQLAQQYQLTGVPAVVVNGKYIIQGEDGKVTQVLNYLIDKERKAK